MRPTSSEARKITQRVKGFPIGSLIKTADGEVMTITNIEAYQYVDRPFCKITAWSPQSGYIRLSSYEAEQQWSQLEGK